MPSGWRCTHYCTVAVSSRNQLPSINRRAASWRVARGNLRRYHTRMPCSRDSCELRVVLLGLLLNSLQVDRETPQQTRVNAEADQPRNADNYGLSSSESTSLLPVCPIVVYVVATEPADDVGHSIGTDYRRHRVLKCHLPTHHLVPVLSRHNLPENWEVAARLSPICKQIEQCLNRDENPYVVEGRARGDPIPQRILQRNAKANSQHGRQWATPRSDHLSKAI